jgi:hypothetical protein
MPELDCRYGYPFSPLLDIVFGLLCPGELSLEKVHLKACSVEERSQSAARPVRTYRGSQHPHVHPFGLTSRKISRFLIRFIPRKTVSEQLRDFKETMVPNQPGELSECKQVAVTLPTQRTPDAYQFLQSSILRQVYLTEIIKEASRQRKREVS